jgi:hypothetical protein
MKNRKMWAGLLGMGLLTMASASYGSTEHYLTLVPATNLLPASGMTGFGCMTSDSLGGVKMAFNQGCPSSQSGQWTTWRYGYIGVAYAPNPGSSQTVTWTGTQPADTQLAGRLVSVYGDGTIASAAGWSYGGGTRSGWNADSSGNILFLGDGVNLLEIGMRTHSTVVTPTVHSIAAQVFAGPV